MEPTQHEIIRVVQPSFLVNSAQQTCRYETADEEPLAPGYYFALWPSQTATRSYGRQVRYFGPFTTQEEAQVVQSCAAYLGLVAPAPSPPQRGARLTAPVRAAYADLLKALRSDRARRERAATRR